MKEFIIEGGNHRYLSELKEFQDGLPVGVINKTKPDVGGTYTAANCDSNYIIVCPFRDLVDSICADTNNKYPVLKVYQGVKESDFTKYMQSTTVHKIAVTYDSFSSKVIKWISKYDNTNNWKVLIDEYHLILEDMDYREDAIVNLIESVHSFKHYSYLSATPINVDLEIDEFKKLPHYTVTWNNVRNISVQRINCSQLTRSVLAVLNSFIDGTLSIGGIKVEELFVFCNSVTFIKRLLETLEVEPEDVKICCAYNKRNVQVLNRYQIEPITNPNKRLNFFTKKGFQGCNLFSNNGLVMVISDGNKESTLVDICTTMEQIAGRLRENEKYHNIFGNVMFHFYSNVKYNLTDEQFNKIMEDKMDRAEILISGYNKMDERERNVYSTTLHLDNELVSITKEGMLVNNLKIQAFKNKQLIRKQYTNDNLMLAAYRDGSGRFTPTDELSKDSIELFTGQIKKITTFSYKSMLQDYLNTADRLLRNEYEMEFTEFRDIRYYMKESELNTLKWSKGKIAKAIADKKMLNIVFLNLYNHFGEGFVSSADVKKYLEGEFDRLQIDLTAKAALIKNNGIFNVEETSKRIGGKVTKGFEIGSRILNFKIYE